MKNVKSKLRVSHFPQVPCQPFIVEVDNEKEAYLIEQTLANQHCFLFDNNFIPDYCNVINVQVKDGDGWMDYYNDEEDMEWEEIKETYFEK